LGQFLRRQFGTQLQPGPLLNRDLHSWHHTLEL
jgi:hypothetical protein